MRLGLVIGSGANNPAAKANQAEAAELLIRRGARVQAADSQGFTPLHLAAISDATAAANVLLRHKANPDVRTAVANQGRVLQMGMRGPDGGLTFAACTPLHLAAMFGQTNMIPRLLKSGAAINATNATGRTPIDLAAQMPMSIQFFRMQNEPGLAGGESFSTSPTTQSNPMASLVERQHIAAALLEQAGGRRTRNMRPGFGPPDF